MFSVVASPRVRNQATVGGVLGDADYASDPPAMLSALGARVVVQSARGTRELPLEEFIIGHYETSLEADELIVEVVVPAESTAPSYRKFRSRSHEDRPCVGGRGRPQRAAPCAWSSARSPDRRSSSRSSAPSKIAADIGHAYAEAIDPISDVRGSAAYRRRVIAVEVRRAVEGLSR